MIMIEGEDDGELLFVGRKKFYSLLFIVIRHELGMLLMSDCGDVIKAT